MTDDSSVNEDRLEAGDFSTWMAEMQAALRGERGADVPCGSCTACCTSSQFVHIEPDETDTLSHIPAELLFPAPFRPRGHVLLGYDERGHCPMLVDDQCSIYEHRPRACRTYDCRIFPASGILPDDGDNTKTRIADQARRWQFTNASEAGEARHEAVRAAAAFIAEHPERLPDGAAPRSATQHALLAIEMHEGFLADE